MKETPCCFATTTTACANAWRGYATTSREHSKSPAPALRSAMIRASDSAALRKSSSSPRPEELAYGPSQSDAASPAAAEHLIRQPVPLFIVAGVIRPLRQIELLHRRRLGRHILAQ